MIKSALTNDLKSDTMGRIFKEYFISLGDVFVVKYGAAVIRRQLA